MDVFESFPEQAEAKRLLRAALADEGPAHAYLFHGPPGVGKRAAAIAFAGELIGDRGRVERGAHPDVYLIEPVGDQIRIDDIRELRRDLHMRPFEADRRVYLVYARGDDERGRRRRAAQGPRGAAAVRGHRPRRRRPRPAAGHDPLALPARSVHATLRARDPRRRSTRARRGSIADEAASLARLAAGRLDRAARLLDPECARRRDALLEVARSVYIGTGVRAGRRQRSGSSTVREECGAEAKRKAEEGLELLDLPTREAEQRVRRAARGAEREELLASLEELASWYRDLVVVAVGAERAVVHADRLDAPRPMTARPSAWPAPSAPASSSARPGGPSRSSTSARRWPSRRSSSSSGASWAPLPVLA